MPVPSDQYVNIPLTNVAVSYLQKQSMFVADKVFPVVPTALQGGLYFTYTKDDFFRIETRERAPATESVGKNYNLTTATFYNRVYALHKDVSDQERATAIDPLGPDRASTELIMLDMLLKREYDWQQKFFTTSVWTGGTGGGDQTGVATAPGANQFLQWDQANSTPIPDVKKQIRAVQAATGYKPNTLTLGPQVVDALENNASIIDRYKYTQKGFLTPDMLAAAFGVDNVYIADAVVNSAAEGATAANAFIFGKAALLSYAPPGPSLDTPSAGYTFTWRGYTGSLNTDAKITKMRVDLLKADRIEAECAYDMEVIAPTLGVYFTAAIA
jgi:hypothetical protein